MIHQTFAPAYGQGVTVASVSTSSAASACGEGAKSLVVTNTGGNTVYVRTGTSTAVATTADYPVLPSAQVSISKPQDHTHVAYITASATSSLHVIPGEGF